MRPSGRVLLRYVEKDAYVMMNVFSGDKLLESKTLNLSDTIVRFEYPYQESYGDGVFVNFCMVGMDRFIRNMPG